MADSDGTGSRQIFVRRKGEHNHFPVWSPASKWIHFVSGNVAIDEWIVFDRLRENSDIQLIDLKR